MSELEFFVYDHDDREFRYFDGDRSRLVEVMTASDSDQISDGLEQEEIDGLLVLDEGGGRWYLAFSSSLGIVGQRTARRQADTIVRSGYTLPDGYWLKANYPMEELNDPNIGDLWQTVQQKYVKDGSLTGLELDEESGIPKQLAERAREMEASGHKDDLTEAKLEKAEAAERRKAAAKSGSSPKPKKTKKAPKKKAKKKDTKKVEKPVEKPAAKKKSTSKKTVDMNKGFLEIGELAEYVHNRFTRIVGKGTFTDEEGSSKDANVIFDQDFLSSEEWNDVVIFLEAQDIVEVNIKETEDGLFATSANK